MPDIYLSIEGQQKGPYTEVQLRKSLTEGIIQADFPAWHEGLTDWVQVQVLLASVQAPPATGVTEVVREVPQAPSFEETAPLVSKPRNRTLKYVGIFLAGLVGLIILGLSAGAGIGLVESHETTGQTKELVISERPYTPPATGVPIPQHIRIWFKVYERAQNSETGWFGDLCDENTGTKTEIIVDFDKPLNLAKDDRLEGVYVPTTETGQWNHTPFRIYKLQGDFKFVDPLTVQ